MKKRNEKVGEKDGGCCCWPSVWQAHKRLPQAPLIGDEKPTAHRVGRKRPQAIASQGKRPGHTLELVMAGHGWANVWQPRSAASVRQPRQTPRPHVGTCDSWPWLGQRLAAAL